MKRNVIRPILFLSLGFPPILSLSKTLPFSTSFYLISTWILSKSLHFWSLSFWFYLYSAVYLCVSPVSMLFLSQNYTQNTQIYKLSWKQYKNRKSQSQEPPVPDKLVSELIFFYQPLLLFCCALQFELSELRSGVIAVVIWKLWFLHSRCLILVLNRLDL